MAIKDICDKNYREFLRSKYAILVIGRDTCVDCNSYDNTMNYLVKRITEKNLEIKVGKVNTNTLSKCIEKIMKDHKAEIKCVPYTVLYKNGKKVGFISNIRDYNYIVTKIKEKLGVEI